MTSRTRPGFATQRLAAPVRPWVSFLLAALPAFAAGGVTRGQEAVTPPREVKVLPVFFVPAGELPPSEAQSTTLTRHLEWARSRYRELLPDHHTFTVAAQKPRVYRAERPLSFYRGQPENGAPQEVSELLAELKYNRCTCPYVLLTVLMNPRDDFPNGGGRPLNGGYNTGGGIIVLSSFALDRIPYFQSTLQHELGHAFGLPHVDVYGYDMKSNASVMSYNPRMNTRGFTPSPTPGKLIPEDLRGLALNQRAFPGLRFDPGWDVPTGYKIAARVVPLGPMTIPGQPDGVRVTTDSGEEFGTKAANVVQGQILPSKKTGRVEFDAKAMWQSAKSPTGWAGLTVTFPYEVELTGVAVHSQHSGQYHVARAVRVSVQAGAGAFRPVATAELRSVDATVAFPKTKGKTWRFDFQAGDSGAVTLRGLQFFAGDDELFPPLVPLQP